jgi:NADH:ubiquinone oxidoreductase subunit 5 (subunit L)/multisubunit Na+/H+ antiporter MnhA subunit
MKAMIVNRIGDVGIALAMFVTYDTFKTLDFESIFAASYFIGAMSTGPSGAELSSTLGDYSTLTILN